MSLSPHGFDGPETDPVPISNEVFSNDDSTVSQTTRLQREHHNAGYLDGVTAAKEPAIQTGFDDGYPNGAELGLRIGRVLGKLQSRQEYSEQYRQACQEMATEKILVPEYWTNDADPAWNNKQETHPIVAKWEAIVASM